MDSLTNKPENGAASFSAFLPLCLLSLSLVIILGWQMTVSVQQYIATIRMADQQGVMADQAAQTERKLQAMMTDLLQLANTDPEAKAIVTKYRIKMNGMDKPAATAPGSTPAGVTPPAPAGSASGNAPLSAPPSSTN
jgi:hypothetical protein